MNRTVRMPQSRIDQLVIQTTTDETLVYDLDRHKAHCLNRAASAVWSHCDGSTTVSEMAEILRRDLSIPADEEVVRLAISQLGKAKLLDGPVQKPFIVPIPARRDVIRRMGLIGGAALLLPLVTSIVAPTAVSASTCLPPGTACNPVGGNSCCSGFCDSATSKCV